MNIEQFSFVCGMGTRKLFFLYVLVQKFYDERKDIYIQEKAFNRTTKTYVRGNIFQATNS